MKQYKPKDIEPKWQKIWDEHGTYVADLQSDKPKYIAMSMFNYPSGAGIHIGHAMNYTISDVMSRFKRQQGYESYHPVGWDAFGLPAENYAIKAGVSPQASMAKIIPSYHTQYKAMGWSNDWTKEIATHEPKYYKWTQWIFSQMYKHGLAYQDARMQWWCDIDKTVLANEQVIDGKCWRHDGPNDPLVEQKEVKQWFFKITDFADELLESTDDLDWTESVKLAQKNWIGKSVGAEIDFIVDGSSQKIKVFTTRIDTLYGATFLVLAPEHDAISSLLTKEQSNEVNEYITQAQKKSEVDRQAAKEKTGVFTGAYAINPLSNEKIPIWVADYVLAGYGTGAIMAVPAHDERDYEFAQTYQLPIIRVIKNDTSDDAFSRDEGELINSSKYSGIPSAQAREKIVTDLSSRGIATEKINYKMRDWSVSRQRYWGAPIPIIHCPQDGAVLVPDDQLPVVLPELSDFAPSGDGRSALARADDWLHVECPACGGPAERETDTLDTYICSSWYMFRYFDPYDEQRIFNSDIINKWAPIDFYNGGDHATAHLLYARFIGHFFARISLINNPEPFKRMLFNGKILASDGSMFSKSKGNGVDPLEVINQGYGADALRTYLMFAAPLEFNAKWDPKGVPATYRFINRMWNIVQEYVEADRFEPNDIYVIQLQRITHSMIGKVSEDIASGRYNTAIAALMKCVNELFKLKAEAFGKCSAWDEALNALVACSAPFTPHASEELWHDLGHDSSVNHDSWPAFNERYITSETMTIVVQVNGKLRATLNIDTNASEDEVTKAALSEEHVRKFIEGKEPSKVIYIPGRLINIVLK